MERLAVQSGKWFQRCIELNCWGGGWLSKGFNLLWSMYSHTDMPKCNWSRLKSWSFSFEIWGRSIAVWDFFHANCIVLTVCFTLPILDQCAWCKMGKMWTYLIGNVNELCQCDTILSGAIINVQHAATTGNCMYLFPPKPKAKSTSVASDWLGSWHMEMNVSKHWCRHWVTATSHTPLPVWFLCNDLGSLDSRLLSFAAP